MLIGKYPKIQQNSRFLLEAKNGYFQNQYYNKLNQCKTHSIIIAH